MNPARANKEALSEKPGAPVIAKPVKTTFPVMLATKTRPRPQDADGIDQSGDGGQEEQQQGHRAVLFAGCRGRGARHGAPSG